jgi:hypothetical protein
LPPGENHCNTWVGKDLVTSSQDTGVLPRPFDTLRTWPMSLFFSTFLVVLGFDSGLCSYTAGAVLHKPHLQSRTWSVWWLIICVNLTVSKYFWVFLWWSIWKASAFELLDWLKWMALPSAQWPNRIFRRLHSCSPCLPAQAGTLTFSLGTLGQMRWWWKVKDDRTQTKDREEMAEMGDGHREENSFIRRATHDRATGRARWCLREKADPNRGS